MTSPRASASTLPCSRVISAASSSLWALTSSRNANITCVRLRERRGAPLPGGLAAACTARSTSAAVANGTRVTTSPVAGSVTSPCRSAGRSSRRPAIQWFSKRLARGLMPSIVARSRADRLGSSRNVIESRPVRRENELRIEGYRLPRRRSRSSIPQLVEPRSPAPRRARISAGSSRPGSCSASQRSAARRPPSARRPRSPCSDTKSASAPRRRARARAAARSSAARCASSAATSSSIPSTGGIEETATTGTSRSPSERSAAREVARARAARPGRGRPW